MKKITSLILFLVLLFWNSFVTFGDESCEYKKTSWDYDNISNLRFSPDWDSFAFIAEKDWKEILVKRLSWN